MPRRPNTPSPGTLPPPAPGTQVLRRSHDMLRLLAMHHRTGLRISEMARALSLEPPTAHRIAQGLVQERMATQDPEDKLYFLGPALYELGLVAGQRFPLRERMQPSMNRLAHETGDTIVLTVRSGIDSVCVDRRKGEFPIQTSMVAVGTRRPLAAGAGGQAILANLQDEREVQWILSQNAATSGRSLEELETIIKHTRQHGYSVNTYRHTHPPIAAIGVPVFGAFGECVAGLAVVALSMRLTGKRRIEVVDLLQREAAIAKDILTELSMPSK